MSKYVKTIGELHADLVKLPAELKKEKNFDKLLLLEANKLVRKARAHAKGPRSSGRHFKVRSGKSVRKIKKTGINLRDVKKRQAKVDNYTVFMNLNDSINKFKNKKNKDLKFYVIGMTMREKGGAFYGTWQMLGKEAYPPSGKKRAKGQISYSGKDFIDESYENHSFGVFQSGMKAAFKLAVGKYFVVK
jgi:hypothetical protein